VAALARPLSDPVLLLLALALAWMGMRAVFSVFA